MMFEWPGRCSRCGEPISRWEDAGFLKPRWIHKACFAENLREAQERGGDLPELQSPEARVRQLEWPMLFFLLLFHFGLGLAVIGWIVIDQGGSTAAGAGLMAIGIVVPLIGITGVALNVISRRRVELVRQELALAGGWKPGR